MVTFQINDKYVLIIYFQFSLIASAFEMKLFIVFAQYKYNGGMHKQNTVREASIRDNCHVNVIYNSYVHIFFNKLLPSRLRI